MNAWRPLLSIVLLVAVACPTSGCLVMGRRQIDQPIDDNAVAAVTRGMSREQVTDLLGAPHEIIFSNREHDPLREHAYVYEFTRQKATALFFGVVNFGNLDSKRDRVVVFFDEDGRVASLGASLHGHESSYGFPFGD